MNEKFKKQLKNEHELWADYLKERQILGSQATAEVVELRPTSESAKPAQDTAPELEVAA